MTQARTLNNRYELQSKIGDGGMAAVYKALDLKLNRIVALKILRDSYASDPQFLARFKREAQQAASLNHPNIVRVFDVGDDGDIHYIVMEYVEGQSLKEVIQAEAPMPTARALEIGAEICDAIGYSHSTGLIHRDIKPQNILMDRSGRVKVTDFGIAKSTNAVTLTEAGITLGTVHYFSPEQAKGQPVLPQSDIYSIGIVLFEMLTGQIPFDSDNPVALAMKHIDERPPSLRRYNPQVPAVVEQIVLRTLAKDPIQRYPTAEALARALRGVEAQAEQGTMAVRPATPLPNPNQTQVRRPAPAPAPNYPDYGATADPYAPQSRPVGPPVPRQPQYQQPPPQYDTYARQAPPQPRRNNGTGYNVERGRGAYNGRPAVDEYQQEYYEEEPRRGGGCLPWVVGGLAFAMIAALIVAAVLILPGVTSPKPATPTVATVPPTTPVAVKKVPVPNLEKQARADAEANLKKLDLQVGEVRFENSDLPAEQVIRTDPKAGTSVEVSTKVVLFVSKGKETAPLIEYFNVSPKDTEAALKSLGFQTQVVEEFNDTVQTGAVIRTDPKGGPNVQVPKGTLIKIFVSKGKTPTPTLPPPPPTTAPPTAAPVPTTAPTIAPVQQVKVPNLVGKKRADGERILRDAEFNVRVEEWDEAKVRQVFGGDTAALAQALLTYNQLNKGEILGTNPPADTLADKKSEVLVAVKK